MSAGGRLCTLQENPHFWAQTIKVRPPDGTGLFWNREPKSVGSREGCHHLHAFVGTLKQIAPLKKEMVLKIVTELADKQDQPSSHS
jgi:hypothetical protein